MKLDKSTQVFLFLSNDAKSTERRKEACVENIMSAPRTFEEGIYCGSFRFNSALISAMSPTPATLTKYSEEFSWANFL